MADKRYVGIDLSTKLVTVAYVAYPSEDWILTNIKTPDVHALVLLLAAIKSRADGDVVVAIEKPFLGKNVATYGKLMAVYGVVVQACIEAGVGYHGVFPGTWQVATLTVGGHRPRNRKELKETSVWVARNAHGYIVKTHDEADAINICYWAMTTKPEPEGKA